MFVLKTLGWVVLTVVLVIGGFVLLASNNPVLASRIAWPLVEWMALDDFVGITTDGEVVTGLFEIKPTGVSTAPVVAAANAFLESLDADQREAVMFAVDDLEWRRWANIHLSTRQGVGLLDMTEVQKEAAHNLLRAGLSARGYQTAVDIMKLEGHLADLMNDYVEYGEERYWFTIMGEPSPTEPWGWQLDGHHLIVNFFVLGDQVVMTPTFMGSEPPFAESGRFAGTRILEAETLDGLALINALTPEQRAVAVLTEEKIQNNNYAELFSDNDLVPEEGLKLSELDEAQRGLAVRLIRNYTDQMRPGHAEVKLTEVISHWDDTYFAWVGKTDADAVFYYRIQSPVVLIEFDHQTPVALDGPDLPTRDHIHTVVRTPNGNDYGKDLLRQHLAAHPH